MRCYINQVYYAILLDTECTMNCFLPWNLKDMTNISAEKLQRNIGQQTSYIELYRSELLKESLRFNIASLLRHVVLNKASFNSDDLSRRATDCLIVFLHCATFLKKAYFAPTDAENPAVGKCARNLHRLMLENVKTTMKYMDYNLLLDIARGRIAESDMYSSREAIHRQIFPDADIPVPFKDDALGSEFLRLADIESSTGKEFSDFDVQKHSALTNEICQMLSAVPRKDDQLPESRFGIIGSCRSYLNTPFIKYGNTYYSFVVPYSLRRIAERLEEQELPQIGIIPNVEETQDPEQMVEPEPEPEPVAEIVLNYDEPTDEPEVESEAEEAEIEETEPEPEEQPVEEDLVIEAAKEPVPEEEAELENAELQIEEEEQSEPDEPFKEEPVEAEAEPETEDEPASEIVLNYDEPTDESKLEDEEVEPEAETPVEVESISKTEDETEIEESEPEIDMTSEEEPIPEIVPDEERLLLDVDTPFDEDDEIDTEPEEGEVLSDDNSAYRETDEYEFPDEFEEDKSNSQADEEESDFYEESDDTPDENIQPVNPNDDSYYDEEPYTALVSPDTYEYLEEAKPSEFETDPMLEEQESLDDAYDEYDEEPSEETVQEEEPDPYSSDSLFDMVDDDSDEDQDTPQKEEPQDDIVPDEEQEKSFPSLDDEVDVQNDPEPEPEPEPEEQPKVEETAANLPLLDSILSFSPSRNNPITQYLTACTFEQQKEIVRVIELARKAWLIDSKDKMFTIPDTSISIAVFSETLDPMITIQRRENIGAVMYASQKDTWNSLELSYDSSGQFSKADFNRISRSSFSDWEWKIVEKLGLRLIERRSK